MKLLASLTAASLLAASFAAPALAHSTATAHVHLPSGAVIYKGSRYINRQFEIDPSILYPVPKRKLPIPIPGPCLSCPTFDMNPGEFVQPVLR